MLSKPHVEINPPIAPPSSGSGALGISSQVLAMLDTIAYAEGTDRSIGDGLKVGYDIIFTFDRSTDFLDHPRRIRCSGSLCSDAAGRYQYLSTTWDGVATNLRLPDFSPISQDRGAVQLIRWRGALNLVEAGRIRSALDSLSFEWASLPDSTGRGRYPGQPIFSVAEVESLFVQAGGVLA